jgi:hypothetical protein
MCLLNPCLPKNLPEPATATSWLASSKFGTNCRPTNIRFWCGHNFGRVNNPAIPRIHATADVKKGKKFPPLRLKTNSHAVISAFGLTWNEAECGTFADGILVIEEMDEVDPNSFSFRYPIDKAGNPSKHHDWGFDLKSFAAPTTKALQGWWELALEIEGLREQHLME